MSTNGSPPDTAVAELSFSFQDELTATIHNAFGVAVEIAVVEITKLVGQVLRDVRDQMDEALRDNKSLKFRLQEAEHELCVARSRQVDEHQSATNEVNTRVQQVHQQLNCLNVSQNTIADKPRQFQDQENTPTNGFALEPEAKDLSESFCEIREDGSVFTHDIKPEMESSSTSNLADDFGTRPKEDVLSIPTGNHEDRPAPHLRQACLETAKIHDPLRTVPGVKSDVDPQVEVKLELADHGCNSTLGPCSGEQEQYSDRLSIAQSRLLEDWRPEPLQLLYNDPDSFVPSTSHSLSDSPNFNPDMPPDLDILSPPGLSVSFAKPYPPPRVPAAAPNSHQPPSDDVGQVNNMAAAQHICKVCGEKFQHSEELSQHHSLVHPKDPNRNPKRNVFPPGRSPFHCSLCGRDFNRMEHLKIHQRRHTGERPYGCTVCSARFRHSWALTRHFRIHTGEKPYACGQCGKTFRNCGGLRFHQRTHSMGGIVDHVFTD